MILQLWVRTPDGPGVARQNNADGAKVRGTRQKEISARTEAQHYSGVIYATFGEKIKKCLKNPEVFPKEYRHYMKKNFWVFEIPSRLRAERCFWVIPRSESDKKVWYTYSFDVCLFWLATQH